MQSNVVLTSTSSPALNSCQPKVSGLISIRERQLWHRVDARVRGKLSGCGRCCAPQTERASSKLMEHGFMGSSAIPIQDYWVCLLKSSQSPKVDRDPISEVISIRSPKAWKFLFGSLPIIETEELLMQHAHRWGQAVGSARGAGDTLHGGVVGVLASTRKEMNFKLQIAQPRTYRHRSDLDKNPMPP